MNDKDWITLQAKLSLHEFLLEKVFENVAKASGEEQWKILIAEAMTSIKFDATVVGTIASSGAFQLQEAMIGLAEHFFSKASTRAGYPAA